MIKQLFLLLSIFMLYSNAYSQVKVESYQWEGQIIDKNSSEVIPFTNVKIHSNGRIFLFAADSNGNVNISYIYPSEHDSIFITSVGYKQEVNKRDQILGLNKKIELEPDDILIQEVAVHPRKIKTKKLGNSAIMTINGTGSYYGQQMVLFIPSNNMKATVLKIRYCLSDILMKKTTFYPFRVRIYDKDTVNNTIGKDILGKNLIVNRNKGQGHWLEVDVSEYNIELPKYGIFVGVEVLPSEYYLSNKIIDATTTKLGKYHMINSLHLGTTLRHSKEIKSGIESWNYNPYNGRWKSCDRDYLFNIVVEPAIQ